MVIVRENHTDLEILYIGEQIVVAKCSSGIEYSKRYLEIEGWNEQKSEPKIEILYEGISSAGLVEYFFEDHTTPMFVGRIRKKKYHYPAIKTGRTLKLNMDTWEIV